MSARGASGAGHANGYPGRRFNAKIGPQSVSAIRLAYRQGETSKSLSRRFHLSGTAIHELVLGKSWKQLPGALTAEEVRRRKAPAPRPSKVPDAIVMELRARHSGGAALTALAREFGYSIDMVKRAIREIS